MLDFLKKYQIHFWYIFAIIGLFAIGYNLFVSHPKEIVKTVTMTQYVDRNIVKTQKQVVDRTIVKKDSDGSVTTTTEHITDSDKSTDKSKIDTKFISKTDVSYLSRYTLGAFYPIPIPSLTSMNMPVFKPTNLIVMGGVRIFNSPIFFNLGTNVGLNSILVGITVEF